MLHLAYPCLTSWLLFLPVALGKTEPLLAFRGHPKPLACFTPFALPAASAVAALDGVVPFLACTGDMYVLMLCLPHVIPAVPAASTVAALGGLGPVLVALALGWYISSTGHRLCEEMQVSQSSWACTRLPTQKQQHMPGLDLLARQLRRLMCFKMWAGSPLLPSLPLHLRSAATFASPPLALALDSHLLPPLLLQARPCRPAECGGWWDAFLRATHLRKRLPPMPQWNMDRAPGLADAIDESAPALKCPILDTLLVEPAVLHGVIFERR